MELRNNSNSESAIAIGKGWHPDEQFAFIRELKINVTKDVQLSLNFMFGLPKIVKKI